MKMPPKKRFITCEICGNRASRSNNEKRMFMARFPIDEARCKQWVKFVGKEDLIYVPIEKLHTLKYVCGNHFHNRAFNKEKNRLKNCAIPSINLKADPLPDAMLLEFPCHIYSNNDVTPTNTSQGINNDEASLCQTRPSNLGSCTAGQQLLTRQSSDMKEIQSRKREQSLSSESSTTSSTSGLLLSDHDYCTKNEIVPSRNRKKPSNSDLEVSPRKRKLIKTKNSHKRKINGLQEGNIMPHIKSLALKTLIEAYMHNHDKKPGRKLWTPIEKALAIAIYKKSPRTYRHLQNLITLPSVETLQTLLQIIELEPGTSQTILDHLNKKVEN